MLAQLKEETNRDRIKSAIVVASIHALLGYVFITGLGFDIVREVQAELKTFNVLEEPPPQPASPPPPDQTISDEDRTKDPEGSAAPANLENSPSPIVAPPPAIRLNVPPPVVAAPVAGLGTADEAGAADVPGPGTGSGGIGTGTGSGGQGYGDGGGGGGGEETPPRWRSGRLRNSDYPPGAAAAGIGGTVSVRYTVTTTGRVADCMVTQSSGSAELDSATCRLIEQRYRYEPSRDENGRAVRSVIVEDHSWAIARSAAPGRRD